MKRLARLAAWLMVALALAGPGWRAVGDGQRHVFVLRGTILEESGQPVDAGIISLSPVEPGTWSMSVPIESGNFKFEVPYPRTKCKLTYTRPGIVVVRLLEIGKAQTEVETSVRIGEFAVLRGRVSTDDFPDGVPNAGVTLRQPAPNPNRIVWENRASGKGTFLLDGVALRDYTVWAGARYHLPSEPMKISPPFPMRVELRPRPASVVIGRVVGGWLDEPVPHAEVRCRSATGSGWTKTADDGRFELIGLAPGWYRLEAFSRESMPAWVDFTVTGGQFIRSLEIRLPPASLMRINGRVVGSDGQIGVPGASVTFTIEFRPPEPPGQTAGSFQGPSSNVKYEFATVTRKDGRFNLDLPVPTIETGQRRPRRWTAVVEAPGYPKVGYGVLIDPRQVNYTLEVFHRGELIGIVRLADGSAPPTQAYVEVQIAPALAKPGSSVSGLESLKRELDPATGRFYFGSVPPGEHWLALHIPGRPVLNKKVVVREGEPVQVELTY